MQLLQLDRRKVILSGASPFDDPPFFSTAINAHKATSWTLLAAREESFLGHRNSIRAIRGKRQGRDKGRPDGTFKYQHEGIFINYEFLFSGTHILSPDLKLDFVIAAAAAATLLLSVRVTRLIFHFSP